MKRRTFMKYAASSVLAANLPNITRVAATPIMSQSDNKNLQVRFLGTGAADWLSKRPNGEFRRFSSILINHHILIDLTKDNLDLLKGDHPDTILYTHSHADHYHPESALKAGVKHVYVSNTWYDICKADFNNIAKKMGVHMPVITQIYTGQSFMVDGLKFTPLPADHTTEKFHEECLIYLIEKDDFRLLYATDTGGIPCHAIDIANFYAKPLNALIIEGTLGVKYHEDYRMFGHSSIEEVRRIVSVLTKTGQYKPKAEIPVYVTHMAMTMHEIHEEQLRLFPKPLKPAYDGQEVTYL